MSSTAYCECEQPVIDVEHDAGCRRCGRPVDFTPAPRPYLELRQRIDDLELQRRFVLDAAELELIDELGHLRAELDARRELDCRREPTSPYS